MRVNRPPEVQVPASPDNYTGGRGGARIDTIVLHKEQGTNGHGWFQNPAAQASAHCCIEQDGTIYRCVDDGDTAWHAGKWDVNLRSLGIEHAGYAEQNDVTPQQYEASARLVAYWAQAYGIPLQHVGGGTQGSWTGRPGVIYHYEVPPPNNHFCPGQTLDMERVIARAQEIVGGGEASPVEPGTRRRGRDDIIGAAIYPQERLLEFARANGATGYALELIPAIYEYAPQRDLGADFLCTQMFLETGFGTYRGASRPYNPAGIKRADATGDAPADFEVPPTADEGARMQVNHWTAVLRLPDEPIGIPHGRYHVAREAYASRSPIRHISQLGNGNWATDPHYAAKLRGLLDELE